MRCASDSDLPAVGSRILFPFNGGAVPFSRFGEDAAHSNPFATSLAFSIPHLAASFATLARALIAPHPDTVSRTP
jgi:hypothetical protein